MSGAKDTTTTKDAAATLYDNLLTIQNTVDLEWPVRDPAHFGVREGFFLGISPPGHDGIILYHQRRLLRLQNENKFENSLMKLKRLTFKVHTGQWSESVRVNHEHTL